MVIRSPWTFLPRRCPADQDSAFRSRPGFMRTLSPVPTSRLGSR